MKKDGSWKQGSDDGGTKDGERLKILNHGRH